MTAYCRISLLLAIILKIKDCFYRSPPSCFFLMSLLNCCAGALIRRAWWLNFLSSSCLVACEAGSTLCFDAIKKSDWPRSPKWGMGRVSRFTHRSKFKVLQFCWEHWRKDNSTKYLLGQLWHKWKLDRYHYFVNTSKTLWISKVFKMA